MNSEIIKKGAVCTTVGDNGGVSVKEKELELINAYTRRKLNENEVYAFSVMLCDNDVDRDNERFTVESLFELEKLFVGKTGIFDHNASAKNQTARIFSCSVEARQGRKTKTGDDYFCLMARAYIPKSDKNSDIILAIDSGIVKEVSVSCAVSDVVCSICGENINVCQHKKGKIYSSKLCCGELVKPYDAYEWSFVAVPAQKNAGVVKSFEKKGKVKNMEDILKCLETDGDVTLAKADCKKLNDYIATLKQSAKDGVYYREGLTSEVLRLSAVVQPDISRSTMENIAKNMTVAQLKEFKTAFEKKKNDLIPNVVQLYNKKNKKTTDSNGQFKI